MYGEILYSESTIGRIRSLIKHIKEAFNKNGIFFTQTSIVLVRHSCCLFSDTQTCHRNF